MQQLNPSEISEVIKKRIENLDVTSQARTRAPSYPYLTVSFVSTVLPTPCTVR